MVRCSFDKKMFIFTMSVFLTKLAKYHQHLKSKDKFIVAVTGFIVSLNFKVSFFYVIWKSFVRLRWNMNDIKYLTQRSLFINLLENFAYRTHLFNIFKKAKKASVGQCINVRVSFKTKAILVEKNFNVDSKHWKVFSTEFRLFWHFSPFSYLSAFTSKILLTANFY